MPVLELIAAALLAQAGPDLTRSQGVTDSLRLALTPQMDGVVMDQEWDQLVQTPDGPIFFQWEPGVIYWAAKAKPGTDVVLSLDLAGDGWLVGDDNIEIRSRLNGDQVVTTTRVLDASDPNGPVWSEGKVIPDTVMTAGKASSEYWNLEGKYTPFGERVEPKLDARPGVRIDMVPSGADLGAAFMPRSMAFTRLRFDKSRDLMSGVTWRPDFRNRSVARTEPLQLRLAFEMGPDAPPMKSIDLGAEGLGRTAVNSMTVPFPGLNRQGRGFHDYRSEIADVASGGWRVFRASVLAEDGRIATLRSSFRVADLLDIDTGMPTRLTYSDQPRTVKATVVLRSQASGRIEGEMDYRLPQDWAASRGKGNKFLIFFARGQARIPVEFVVPAGASGVFPVTVVARVGERVMERRTFIVIR